MLISPTGPTTEDTILSRLCWRYIGIRVEGPIAGEADLKQATEDKRDINLDLKQVCRGEQGEEFCQEDEFNLRLVSDYLTREAIYRIWLFVRLRKVR
jgi:hypothetical protein